MTEISELRHRIVIESVSLTQNDSGGQSEVWSTFTTLWAKIDPRQAQERYFAQRLDDNITHVITTRYCPGVTSSMRVIFLGRTFQIKTVTKNDEIRHLMKIMAVEGVGS